MELTVEVLGGETHTLDLEDPTYGTVLDRLGLSPQEASVLVDDRPVPADEPVATDRVRVVKLVSGG